MGVKKTAKKTSRMKNLKAKKAAVRAEDVKGGRMKNIYLRRDA